MSFGGLILTNKGRNLQVKAQTGVTLNYSKVKIGDGEIGSSSILDMNDLKNTLHVLDISNIRRNGNQITIRTIVTNKELQEGFYFREIGVFAEDPDEGEILYCYANARSNSEYIPAAGTDIVEKNIDVVVIVGQAENVTATIDESLIFASKKDVESKVSKVEGKGLSDENYSTEEKDKLAGIEEGAQVNRGISDSISSDSSEAAASSKAVKQVNDKVNNRVVKVSGKGLSTEDYSTEEKNKLAGIEENAENYTHPANHPAAMISITDTDDNFTSDNVEGALAEVKQLVQDTMTQVSQQLGVSSFHIEGSSIDLIGSKKQDSLCWDNKCSYANTSTSANITLGHTTINKLRFNKYTLIVRLKSKNSSLSSGLVKIDVIKKNGSSYQTLSSRTIKANEFANTSQYKSFYIPFEYYGPKATENELKIQLTLLKQSSVFEVCLDSISVTLTALGVFSI